MRSIERAATAAGIAIRTKVEALWDRLSVEIAPLSDPDQMHALLVENGAELLTDISALIAAIGNEIR